MVVNTLKRFIVILSICFSNMVFCQEFENNLFDTIILDKSYEREIRIRTDTSLSNEYKLTRIFQDSLKQWHLERYVSNGFGNNYVQYDIIDDIDQSIRKDSLFIRNTKKIFTKNFDNEFYKIWLELLTTNILYLPSFESIEYKLGEKKVIELNEQLEIIEEFKLAPNDGICYMIEIKDRNKFNNVEICNPYFYIKEFPAIDEFTYLDKFLKLIDALVQNN